MNLEKNIKGRYYTSYIISGNAYQVLSSDEEFQKNLLDETGEDRLDGDNTPHYAEVSGNGDPHSLWMVFFESDSKRIEDAAGMIESAQDRGLYHQGIFWPFDLIRNENGSLGGYLIRPIDSARYPLLRTYLGKNSVRRWDLAISLFERIRDLHGFGLTQNGLQWEQLRVEDSSKQVFIWADMRVSNAMLTKREIMSNGFLSLPSSIERGILKEYGGVDGQLRDIFSCAVMAFYLLFFIHPFVGSAYWNLMREGYYVQYMEHPAYNMDPDGGNQLGYQDFEEEIQRLWKHTDPELRQMFDEFFTGISRPESGIRYQKFLDPNRWIELLKRDAEEMGSPDKRTDFPFEIIKNYQV